jgi:serine/threonine-protein kinase
MDTATAILSETVPPLTRYTDDIPVLLQHTVRKMLAKEPDRRYQLIHDVRTNLGELIAGLEEGLAKPTTAPLISQAPRRLQPWAMVVGLVVLTAIVTSLVVWSLIRSSPPVPQAATQFVITPPPSVFVRNIPADNELAISPDGRRIVYLTDSGAGGTQLYVRSLDEVMAKPIPGTENADGDPFFSSDGEWLAFFTLDAKLKKVSLMGGTPVTLCNTTGGYRFGSWAEDTIVFSSESPESGLSLYRVSAAGGEPEILVSPDAEKGELQYLTPEILPGGKTVLFTILKGPSNVQVAALSLETKERKIVLEGGRVPRYAPTGHLVYGLPATGTLMAVPFDLARLEITGSPVPILEGVRQGPDMAIDYALSDEGTLVYVPGQTTDVQRLVWVDRKGTESVITQEDVSFGTPRISPNGRQIAVAISAIGETQNIWIYDLENESLRRLTFAGGGMDTWSPDGKWIIFQGRDSEGRRAISRQLADGSGPVEQLTTPTSSPQMPQSLTPDGSVVAFSKGQDIWMLEMEGDREPQPFIISPNFENYPKFSPDGKWLAYVSSELGPMNVYVSPYPKPDVKYLVSEEEGGGQPVWSPDGTELFYRSGNRMMVVSIETDPAFRPGRPEVLFEGRYVNSRIGNENPYYDIAPDGQQFLMIKEDEGSQVAQINVVLNWFDELKRLVPTDN